MASSIRERMEQRAGGLVGRAAERALLDQVLDDDGPLVVFVHGIGGVGKSALLRSFARNACDGETAVIELDGGAIEPSIRGLFDALAPSIGRVATVDDVAARLAALGPTVILLLDRYELLQPLDPWLRQSFVPILSDRVRLVLSGRAAPSVAWSMEMGPLFRSLALGNLPPVDAERLLVGFGLDREAAAQVNRIAHGHPLSLRLAAATVDLSRSTRPQRDASTIAVILAELTELYLERLDPETRRALDAASVVRRPTKSLLGAMLPDVAPSEAFERLRGLPFVELGPEGLVLHDTFREVVAGYLRASDPDRSRAYRVAAWRELRDEVARAGSYELSRYTADLLYLVEDPAIREAWFPAADLRFVVGAARPDDLPAILELSRRQFPGVPVDVVEEWWRHAPWAFRVARDEQAEVRGFCGLSDPERLPRSLADIDPVVRRWRDHLRQFPLPKGQRAVASHFERADPDDPASDAIHAALGLDTYRTWMELRPALRRYYASVSSTGDFEPPWVIGLHRIGSSIVTDGITRHPYYVDFGPASVDGWLAGLVGAELGVDDGIVLDAQQRQIVVDGNRVDLTRLELGVFRLLSERPDRVIERGELLREIWGYNDSGGSNVIEAVVSSLRTKLGSRAGAIETVRGVGYRFVDRPADGRARRDREAVSIGTP